MRRTRAWLPLGFVAALAGLAACSNSEEEGDVITLDARGGSARRTLPAADIDHRFFLVPFSAPSSNPTGQGDYRISAAVSEAASSQTSASTALMTLSNAGDPYGRLWGRFRSEKKREGLWGPALEKAWAVKTARPDLFTRFYRTLPRASLASEIRIYSPFTGEVDTSITGVLRAQSAGVGIYVDSRDTIGVSDPVVEELLQAVGTITLPRLHALAGTESDVDGNGAVAVFLASKERFDPEDLGYFRPTDLLPDEAVTGSRSNEREIVYVRVPDSEVPGELANAVIAHELFHLIHFAGKTLPLYQSTGGAVLLMESTFLSEGLAHLAEDLTGWGLDTALLTRIYLDCLAHTSLAGSGSSSVSDMPSCQLASPDGDSLPRRGGMMLFLMYLFQQSGGAEYSATTPGDLAGTGLAFLRKLVTSTAIGIPNLESATGRSFFSLYGGFAGTLVLDGLEYSQDPRYALQPEVTDPFTGLLRYVRLHSTRPDIGGGTVELDGPAIFQELDLTDSAVVGGSLFSSGANVILLNVAAGNDLDLTVEAGSQLSLGVAVVRL